MSTYSLYELKCPSCSLQFTQMVSDREEGLPVLCPSCDVALEKGRKLTGSELLSCVYSYGGG